MSDRRQSTQRTAGRDKFRDVDQRLQRIETHIRSLQTGRASAGQVQLLDNGNVSMTVVLIGTGPGRQVIFKNLLTGSTSILSLP